MRGKGHGKRNRTEAGAVRFGVVQGGTSLMEDELNQTSYALIDLLQNMTALVYVVVIEVKRGLSSSRKMADPSTGTILRIAVEKSSIVRVRDCPSVC